MSIEDRLKGALDAIKHPEPTEEETEFRRQLGFKRLLFLLPFLIAAAVVLFMALK